MRTVASSLPPGACPGVEELLAFARGLLRTGHLEAVADHIDACPRCLSVLGRLERAGRAPLAFVCDPPDPYGWEPGCRELRARARTIRVDHAGARPLLGGPGGAPGSTPRDELFPPERLGRYRLLEQIGQGGMGVVYKALDTGRNRVVALKVLAPRWLDDPEARARFNRELALLGDFYHPHVLRAIDGGAVGEFDFLVMKYVEGTDLDRLSRTVGPLPVSDACELARQAAYILHYIHACGLVHRDVKPSNLLLTPRGHLKVLDLGLARLRGEDLFGGRLTATGQLLGTAGYLAPEQASDARLVDGRSDLYGLGCTLYHLLTGQAPFAGPECRSAFDTMMAHKHMPRPALRGRRSDVPEGLAAVVHRLLAKAPADRYPTGAEVAAALLPFTAGCDLARLAARKFPCEDPSSR
ncbi:MAG TPA: serine/threonine-protein kinase [Gemmataceae bacterium]|nr:serine/threonine-protein kinase [Gemmataceae bacterium]